MDLSNFDSLKDTYEHIKTVRKYGTQILLDWLWRLDVHDNSKTTFLEKPMYDKYTPLLKDMEYGSKEYEDTRKKMGTALQHHYENNRHHPEFFVDSIDGMNLIDMMEMLADWKAASERMKNGTGDLRKSIEINCGPERFNVDEKIKLLLLNTASYLGWI